MYESKIEKFSENKETNDNEQFEFTSERKIRVVASLCEHIEINKTTWISPDWKTKHQIGHILIKQKRRKTLQDLRSYRGVEQTAITLLKANRRIRYGLSEDIAGKRQYRKSYEHEL